MHTEVKITRRIKIAEVRELYIEAGWWKPEFDEDIASIRKLVRKSFLFAAAFHDGKLVGMGRAISDASGDAYIQDVVVFKRFRGKGVGGRIISALTAELTKRGIDWVGLIAQPGTEKFYNKLGFKRMPRHIPMLFSPSNK